MTAATLAFALSLCTAEARLQAPAAPRVSPHKDAVKRGLKWLAGQQKADGGWKGLNDIYPTQVTATAGLALLMEGSTPKSGTYAAHIRKAMAWLEANAHESGRFGGKDPTEVGYFMWGHTYALMFLASAYDVDDDEERRKRVRKLLEKAVAFTCEMQTARGGWGYAAPGETGNYDDNNFTPTTLQALLAARKVGIAVPKKSIDAGVQYMVRSTLPNGGVGYSPVGSEGLPPGNDDSTITASATAAVLMLDGHRPEEARKWVGRLQPLMAVGKSSVREQPERMLRHYHLARAVFALGDNGHARFDPAVKDEKRVRWSEYREKAFVAVMAAQTESGGWPDLNFGNVHTTALALVILQLDNDYLPAFSR